MEIWHVKTISGILMFVAILVCFLLPIKLTKFFCRSSNNGQYVFDLLTCFAGGVFLSVYLLFMAPAARELIVEGLMKPHQIEYPIPDVLIGAGFCAILLLNRVVVSLSRFSRERRDHHRGGTSATGSGAKPLSASSTATTELAADCANGTHLAYENDNRSNRVDSAVDVEAVSLAVVTTEDNAEDLPQDPSLCRSSIVDVARQDSMARSIVLMMALSLDSVLEGATTGLKTTVVEVWAIFFGNLVHETVIAFCLGLQLLRVHDKVLPVVVAAVFYALMNPVGLVITTAVYETQKFDPRMYLVNGILQALISGCFIYVTFCEILAGQITHRMPYAKIFALFAGFAVLAVFSAVPGSSSYSFAAATCSPIVPTGNITTATGNIMTATGNITTAPPLPAK